MPDAAVGDLAPAFRDPVFDGQRVFRAVMAASARPGRVVAVATDLAPPAPLAPAAAAVALALADHETPVWLDPPLAAAPAVVRFLRFHTGAAIVDDPARAAFALVADAAALPPFAAFAQGTDAYPDRSTTLVVQVATLDGGTPLVLTGPGILGTATLAPAPLPADVAARLAANRALFPRGVDLVLCAAAAVAVLPRSVRVVGEGV